MPEYTVQWMIELNADNPREAAQKALEIQRDKRSLATHFTVIDETGATIDIDDAEAEDTCADCDAVLPPDHDHCEIEGCDNCLCPTCYAAYGGVCQECYMDSTLEE